MEVIDIQGLASARRARPRNLMITRALRLFEELSDLNLVGFLQQVRAAKKTSLLSTRQHRNNANFFTEANSLALIVVDSTFN